MKTTNDSMRGISFLVLAILISSLQNVAVKWMGGHYSVLQIVAIRSLIATSNKRVNIRISSRDLEGLQARAAEEGVPYQTLMASVLHKFVSGRLVETQRRITTRSSRTARKRAVA